MNRHQVLTGACNSGDQCYAVGSVEGIHFTAYAAGCDIVILASDFQRVQIIPGVTHGNVKVNCIDCSTDTGKIAASYQNKVYIFEPTPLLHHESTHDYDRSSISSGYSLDSSMSADVQKLDYQWYQTAMFEAKCFINCLTWNMEGSKLLTGGNIIQIWQYIQEQHDDGLSRHVHFSVGGHEEDHPHIQTTAPSSNMDNQQAEIETIWECAWSCKPASAVYHLKFSPDGLLFASAGKADRLVKIWYEDRKIQIPMTLSRADSIISPKKEEQHYSFVYLAHPRAVTGFSWRKTSKYMPRGSVANMLVTSCADNVCRLWCETILPDDGLVDLEQFDPTTSMDRKFHTHRHKKRFMARLKTIRHAIHKRRKHHKFGPETLMSMPNLASINSVASVHDFHKFSLHHNNMAPALHFHLAASINPETDIPLLPVVGSKGDLQHNFQLHWLNNKELQFTMEAEVILQDLHKSTSYDNDHHDNDTGGSDSDHSPDQPHIDDTMDTRGQKKKKQSIFTRIQKGHKNSKGLGSHSDSQSSLTSDPIDHMSEGAGSSTNSPEMSGMAIDALDRKIEMLLKDWHQNADMLFSVHPVDGSFLVWLVDWLDEYNPYCFRQAQVSFSSRLPHAFPVPDARTMASNMLMYCNYSKMDIKSAMKISENKYTPDSTKIQIQPAPATGKCFPGQNDNMLIPNVLLISKHLNGSLNQWQVSFSDNSKFSTVVSVAHASRACGHRFRTNSAACHPALPLLLTTSHHNVPKALTPLENGYDNFTDIMCTNVSDNSTFDTTRRKEDCLVGGVEFCSELILWRVDPVGPLSKSGGIIELARINSPQLSAFSNVAWVPTLLPSSTLGTYSNSPSALFVASDGNSLMMYQAVIDARTLLLEMGAQKKETQGMSFSSNTSSGYSVDTPRAASELFNIVSLQSSARPGCIIEMEAIADAKQDWHQTQFLHVFQEQLVTGKLGSNPNNLEAIVDLRNSGSFSENFYLVVLEKCKDGGSIVHMWKINIASQAGVVTDGEHSKRYAPDTHLVEDDGSDPPSRSNSPDHLTNKSTAVVKLSFSTTKVCTQTLGLPDGVDVVCASVAAGHLSSASIYPACLAPYLLVTACSDGETRFWRCDILSVDQTKPQELQPNVMSWSTTSFELSVEDEEGIRRPSTNTTTWSEALDVKYDWQEWSMMGQTPESSSLDIPGQPISVSCAYSGRVAIAYRLGGVRSAPDNKHNKFVNLYVAVYECESTGGSEWILEDTIELKNISIPDPKAEIDLNCIFSPDSASPKPFNGDDETRGISPSSSLVNINRTKSVPSLSTIYTVRKCISEHGNRTGMLQQKHLVQLDWVSTEDGSHILTVGVGSKILMYAQVSNDIVQSSKRVEPSQEKSFSQNAGFGLKDASHRRAMMQKSKSMVVDDHQEEIKWMKLRTIELSTADGLPPLPMHLSWVRAGILVVGMDNEMHVYSQWRGAGTNDVQCSEETDNRSFDDFSFPSKTGLPTSLKSAPAFKPSYSMPSFKHWNNFTKSKKGSEASLLKFSLSKSKSESSTSLSVIHEYGLFEAARYANPVLPQYHPKKLMELLNFGKIRRVKAILAHLVRYIGGGDIHQTVFADEYDGEENKWTLGRPRGISVSGSPGDVPVIHEEPQLDYREISSIPPLPIYALLAADEDNTVAKADAITSTGQPSTDGNDYSDLFDNAISKDDELDITVLPSSVSSMDSKTRQRLQSTNNPSRQNPNYFGPEHSQQLTQHLTHTQLPGLSSLDQMYLLALADTVANTKMDFADRMETETQRGGDMGGLSSNAAESMDDCGLRFIIAMRHHIYLLRTLPPRQRVVLRQQGLKNFNLVWGFHSEATEELLSYIPSMQRDEPTWEELKQFGAGWWINNINILRRCIEKVAKAAFQSRKDPMDAAIFYLAMKKKNVLWGLYRSIDDKKMQTFFRNDFSQDRWRKAALKNAFSLLGRQRFTHAAAFFLLAGALSDAVEVCLDKLGDLQLAMVICRLYEGEDMMPDSVKSILYTHILGCDSKGNNCDNLRAHPDPFLRSMALWLLKDYRGSLNTLLHSSVGQTHKSAADSNDLEGHNAMPSVFNFYNYLRTHPLLVRQRIAATGQSSKKKNIIPGFTRQQTVVLDDSSVFVDKVTPMERRLFFSTAHSHYMNGCPLLALEVLSKLPPVIEDKKTSSSTEESKNMENSRTKEDCIKTGTLEDFGKSSETSRGVDWSQPLVNGFDHPGNGFDWSSPVSSHTKQTADSFDWGAPVSKFDSDEPSFKISSDEDEEEVNDKYESESFNSFSEKSKGKLTKIPTIVIDEASKEVSSAEDSPRDKSSPPKSQQQVDIFAQQIKFTACLKVLMEEMQTLATGFEVDGGQLRFQLYIWLEREVEVLNFLCNYGGVQDSETEEVLSNQEGLNGVLDDDSLLDNPRHGFTRSMSTRSTDSYKPTLHEVILAEKMDFEAKLERMTRRKHWLKTNQQLLRTLASYCVLQGAGGGGLASVEMELLLLLQELQQEKPQQQLLSPLPFPTTLPLLSASIASSKTVVADPIQHIQCMTQDLLHSIIEITSPPGLGSNLNTALVMRNLSVSLSSCIYQCLCDCDSFVVSLNESHGTSVDGFMTHNFNSSQAGHLMAGVQRYRRKSSSGDDLINTPPSKWPGVTSLRVLLAREKDDAAPKLNILLCESLIAVYVSLLVNAMATYDCHMLYRLVAHRFEHQMWSALFGGGVKTALKVSNTPGHMKMGDDLLKNRMKFNWKVMGPANKENKPMYKETFVPPELSMISFFMTKPFHTAMDHEFHYDSEDSLSEEEEDESDDEDDSFRPKSLPLSTVQQHTDPTSFSWCLIRYSILRLVLHNLHVFLPQIGIELQELPICSTLMHAVLKTLEQWMEILKGKLELFAGPPDEFIAGLQLDVVTGVPQSKYKILLQPLNSPFIDNHSALPIKRLWFHLLKQEQLRDVFLRYIYRKKKPPQYDMQDSLSQLDTQDGGVKVRDPMKVIHKEQDIITAFALNQANTNCLALSTQKEIVELDVGPLLNPPAWLEDENEMDIEYIRNPNPPGSSDNTSSDFFVVQTPADGHSLQSAMGSGVSSPQTGASTPTHLGQGMQTGRGTNVLLRRPVPGVRRIGSHPHLPHYLTGGSDGSVRLYEWGHIQPLAMLRQPGVFPKVTKVLFSGQGNKCCVSDTEGDICLWQVGLGSNFNKPIMSLKCHNKTTSDFAFVGSSSLIATAGHSSESKNVCLWDTLMPPKNACVHAFTCHEHGCPAVVYAPHHQLLITGGRKGEICIFDIRQRQLRHTFQAHESAIRCMSIDPEEEFFVTGSSEGDIKVWGLDVHQLVVGFPGEHSKNTTFFRNMGSASGVTQLVVSPSHHLFSCGVDGSMKFRALPERESIVRYWSST